ncbi:Uncharacterised protein [Edwardsiella hoshinae]|uniref:Uncharacterized protein n=1 Tax=Edwardsiella hoshinae TaxID=93378 RepID=A0A376DF62_9GAMM|nr:Uncharacterised protein [Edwardsiella hoshinae]
MEITIKQLPDKSIAHRRFCERLVYFLASTVGRAHDRSLFPSGAWRGERSIQAAVESQRVDDLGGDLFDRVVGGIEVVDLLLTV